MNWRATAGRLSAKIDDVLSSERTVALAHFELADALVETPHPIHTTPFSSELEVYDFIDLVLQPTVEAMVGFAAHPYRPKVSLGPLGKEPQVAEIINDFNERLRVSQNGHAKGAKLYACDQPPIRSDQRYAFTATGRMNHVTVSSPQGSAALLAHELTHHVLRNPHWVGNVVNGSEPTYNERPISAWEEGICEIVAKDVTEQLAQESNDRRYLWPSRYELWKAAGSVRHLIRSKQELGQSSEYHITGISTAYLLERHHSKDTAKWMLDFATESGQ